LPGVNLLEGSKMSCREYDNKAENAEEKAVVCNTRRHGELKAPHTAPGEKARLRPL